MASPRTSETLAAPRTWSQTAAAAPPHRVLRVNQLDARRLDAEIGSLLKGELAQIFAPWDSHVVQGFMPELEALLRMVIWRYTVWIDQATPAGRLQNVRYASASGGSAGKVRPLSKKQKVGLLLVGALFPWFAARLGAVVREAGQDDDAAEGGSDSRDMWPRLKLLGRRWARWYLRTVEPRTKAVVAVCTALNFLVFLRRGVFLSLAERFLGARLVHVDPTAHRQVAFEYMNRVMIWNGLSEFLMTMVPLVNLAQLQRAFSRRLFPKAMTRMAEPDVLGVSMCGFCGASPAECSVPMRAECGHVFCYFCATSEQLERGSVVPCPRCGSPINSLEHAR